MASREIATGTSRLLLMAALASGGTAVVSIAASFAPSDAPLSTVAYAKSAQEPEVVPSGAIRTGKRSAIDITHMTTESPSGIGTLGQRINVLYSVECHDSDNNAFFDWTNPSLNTDAEGKDEDEDEYSNDGFDEEIYDDYDDPGAYYENDPAHRSVRFGFTPTIAGTYDINVDYTVYEYNIDSEGNLGWHSVEDDEYTGDDSISDAFTVQGKLAFSPGKKATVSTPYKYVDPDEEVGTLPKPTLKNARFNGWYLRDEDDELTKRVRSDSYIDFYDDMEEAHVSSLKAYAKWSYGSKLKFKANGGTCSVKSKKAWSGDRYGKLPTPKRKNHCFFGWYTKKLYGKEVTSKTKAGKKDRTVYAQWGERAKVRLYGNGGKAKKKSKYVWSNENYGKLPKAKRSGYQFKGWYTKKKGGKKVTAKTFAGKYDSSVVKYKKLYAHWFGPKGHGKTITKAEFRRIKNGMTHGQVKYLIGGGGSLLSSYGGYEVYEWKGRGQTGANANIEFDDAGEVYGKAQWGLR
jgi:uncharacterized repeat protein (TIGR02543 family)